MPKNKNKQHAASQSTWFDQQLSQDHQDLQPISGATNGYFYANRRWLGNLLGNDKDLIKKFIDNFDPTICGPKGEKGLKRISDLDMSANQVVNGKTYENVPVQYEMKVKGDLGASRVWVAVYKSEDGKSWLAVPIAFSDKGLHRGKAFNNKQAKHTLQAPALTVSAAHTGFMFDDFRRHRVQVTAGASQASSQTTSPATTSRLAIGVK